MKFSQFIALFLILLFLTLVGCKPSQEEFSKLEQKQTQLEQRVSALEIENSKIKDLISTNVEYKPENYGILKLDPFITNLSDKGGKRYIKLEIEIEFGSKELLNRSKPLTNKMRDKVLLELTKLSFADLLSPEGKIRLRNSLIQDINDIIQPSTISNLYFTDLVIQ